ncbi:uncharacterized protein K441DRAFT_185316 [Cenococcum geophilum 1.58]|uniref:uncharacterized protein n=1 Tax=Cenococcum geophilum 1.58 TaxID=794803 RepID=UPI00358E6A14|nr:hypothetical protein K441DRAFT_185316 [Cenococcum geophilum 1.58]
MRHDDAQLSNVCKTAVGLTWTARPLLQKPHPPDPHCDSKEMEKEAIDTKPNFVARQGYPMQVFFQPRMPIPRQTREPATCSPPIPLQPKNATEPK